MKKWGNRIKGWNFICWCVIFNFISFFGSDVFALELVEKEMNVEETEIVQGLEEIEFDEEEEILLSKEEIFTSNSENLEFQKDKVIVKGNIKEETTVENVLANISFDKLLADYEVLKIGITNEEGILLNDADIVTNFCHLVFIGSNFVIQYQIQFLGDLNQDNVVTEDDIETGLDQFLENTEEGNLESNLSGVVSYVDAVVDNNTYEVESPIEEELNGSLDFTNYEKVFVEDTILVGYKIEGLEENYINTISGTIQYNQEILVLVNVYVFIDGKVIGDFLGNQFIYVLNSYQGNEVFLFFEFRGLKSGSSNISLENLKVLMNGSLLQVRNSSNLEVGVLEYGKDGDDIIIPPVVDSKPVVVRPIVEEKETIILTPTVYNTSTSHQVVTTVLLSNDNYIKSLEIKGYAIDFDKDVNRYSITVDNNIFSLNLNVLLNHDNSSYLITGNEKFKTGNNEIILTVFAEDGSSRDYVIEVNKKEKEDSMFKLEDNEKELKRIILFIILVIFIITVVFLIYQLLKGED